MKKRLVGIFCIIFLVVVSSFLLCSCSEEANITVEEGIVEQILYEGYYEAEDGSTVTILQCDGHFDISIQIVRLIGFDACEGYLTMNDRRMDFSVLDSYYSDIVGMVEWSEDGEQITVEFDTSSWGTVSTQFLRKNDVKHENTETCIIKSKYDISLLSNSLDVFISLIEQDGYNTTYLGTEIGSWQSDINLFGDAVPYGTTYTYYDGGKTYKNFHSLLQQSGLVLSCNGEVLGVLGYVTGNMNDDKTKENDIPYYLEGITTQDVDSVSPVVEPKYISGGEVIFFEIEDYHVFFNAFYYKDSGSMDWRRAKVVPFLIIKKDESLPPVQAEEKEVIVQPIETTSIEEYHEKVDELTEGIESEYESSPFTSAMFANLYKRDNWRDNGLFRTFFYENYSQSDSWSYYGTVFGELDPNPYGYSGYDVYKVESNGEELWFVVPYSEYVAVPLVYEYDSENNRIRMVFRMNI